MNTDKKYQVIYADPPWHYGKSSWILTEGGNFGKEGKAIQNKDNKIYPTLTKQELMELKINKYQVVYADPPWHFNNNLDNASNGKSEINADKNYPTMKSKAIADLPIKDLTEDDAICFMWTTDTHLPQAIEIMKAWGFTYKTVAFVWEKLTKNGKPAMVMAPWIHKNCELCLMGTKGTMMKYKQDNTVQQIIKAERTAHSKKPQEAADRIVKLFPEANRIELFARDAKPGWDVWGNEVQSDIQMTQGESHT